MDPGPIGGAFMIFPIDLRQPCKLNETYKVAFIAAVKAAFPEATLRDDPTEPGILLLEGLQSERWSEVLLFFDWFCDLSSLIYKVVEPGEDGEQVPWIKPGALKKGFEGV